MIAGLFDIPYERDFTISFDKGDVTYQNIYDLRTGKNHLFIDLGNIEGGTSTITNDIQRIPENPELVNNLFAPMYFGDHAYLRCTDKETAIAVTIPAPKGGVSSPDQRQADLQIQWHAYFLHKCLLGGRILDSLQLR